MFETLEEAQEHILELDEQISTLTGERDSLSQNNENLVQENERLRKLNQKYFNKLIAHEDNPEKKDKEDDVQTCEDFALSLKI